jgi:hypothetical protein
LLISLWLKNKRKNSGYIGKYPYFPKDKQSFSAYLIQIVGFWAYLAQLTGISPLISAA